MYTDVVYTVALKDHLCAADLAWPDTATRRRLDLGRAPYVLYLNILT